MSLAEQKNNKGHNITLHCQSDLVVATNAVFYCHWLVAMPILIGAWRDFNIVMSGGKGCQ
jgi:hypothetical protein